MFAEEKEGSGFRERCVGCRLNFQRGHALFEQQTSADGDLENKVVWWDYLARESPLDNCALACGAEDIPF